MKRILLLLFSLTGIALAQNIPTPDCTPKQFSFSGGNGNLVIDNRSTGCDSFTIVYQADSGLMGYTLSLMQATGLNSAGFFGAYTGNVVASSPSFGTAQVGIETVCNLATCVAMGGVTVNTPWLEVSVSGATGKGALAGTIYGYRTGYTGGAGGSGGGGGGGSGCPNPCPVEGVDASGAAPTVPPVAVAGNDGTDVRPIRTDSTGRPVIVGGASTGAVQVGNPVPIAGNDGTDVRTIHTDSGGNVDVNVQGTVPISGACPNPCPVTQNTTPWATSQVGLGTFTGGQTAVTGTAGNLGTNTTKSVCVKALIGNTINVYVGGAGVTTSTGFELPPGQGVCPTVNNTNLIFVVASTTGASVSWEFTN